MKTNDKINEETKIKQDIDEDFVTWINGILCVRDFGNFEEKKRRVKNEEREGEWELKKNLKREKGECGRKRGV